jgi:hypothetical protein
MHARTPCFRVIVDCEGHDRRGNRRDHFPPVGIAIGSDSSAVPATPETSTNAEIATSPV